MMPAAQADKKSTPKKLASKKKPAKKTSTPKAAPKAAAKSSAKISSGPAPDKSLSKFVGRPARDFEGKLLVVIDETSEALTALRFAGVSAKRLKSRVVLLMVLEPATSRHWLGVESIMKEEAREDAMQKMRALAKDIFDYVGITPDIVIREGKKFEQLAGLVGEDSHITTLVLGVAHDNTPQPLVAKLLSGELEALGIPVVIVPENISDDMLRKIARII